jgi:hypothetical protein
VEFHENANKTQELFTTTVKRGHTVLDYLQAPGQLATCDRAASAGVRGQ